MVRSERVELSRPYGHTDLNRARLPIPPRPHSRRVRYKFGAISGFRSANVLIYNRNTMELRSTRRASGIRADSVRARFTRDDRIHIHGNQTRAATWRGDARGKSTEDEGRYGKNARARFWTAETLW